MNPLAEPTPTRIASFTRRVALCLFALGPFGLAGLASSEGARVTARLDHWVQAVALREQLEATAPEQRTAQQYEAVLNGFRKIYHDDPTAAKAPAAVAAVADLLAEKGRLLHDQRSLQAALGQYEFLRQQYPKSPQVDNALLLEGEICRQDLKDLPCATDKFHQVIDASPGSSFAEQASIELKEMQPAKAPKAGHKTSLSTAQGTAAKSATPSVTAPTESSLNLVRPLPAPTPVPIAGPIEAVTAVPQVAVTSSVPSPATSSTTSESHKIVQITGMRHWSNPTSTRIAIDLGGKVEYEAARVPNPDRIFFDLHGARLAPSLNGHQVEVIDDGYLKRIRAAQFHPDVTRVVLDVTDVSQYSAFLLPNPWRLIIDIHSDKDATKPAIAKSKLSVAGPSDSTDFADLPQPNPASNPAHASGAGRSNDSTMADVAKLSSEPAKIPATAGPTSGPVSAKVPAITLEQGAPAISDDSDSLSASTAPKPALPTAGVSIGGTTNKSRKKGHASATSTTADLAVPPALPHAADPDADGQRSLVRALGLKVGRIAIDAGHGGHDSGTLGPGGIEEKDVVLDVALRVGTLLHKRLGAEIVYTRDTDIFIPLETRTAIANKAQADLFLSIHANSSSEPEARGVETYYLNFTSDPNALEVAARENAVSTQSVHQLSELVRKITLKDKIDESREFAADVDDGLYAGLKSGNAGLKDRGVKKAPFVVLIGAQMPSILAEISFLTNPNDAEQLQTGPYRQRIAVALVAGVERYLRGLSGTRTPDGPSLKTPSKRPTRASARNQEAGDGQ